MDGTPAGAITPLTYAIMALFFAIALGRSLTMRQCSVYSTPSATALLQGNMLLIACVLSLPFLGHYLLTAKESLLASPWLILVSISKGLIFWLFMLCSQALRRISNSSTEFRMPLTVGVVAVVNMFLGEKLPQHVWLAASILFLSALSLLSVAISCRPHFVPKGFLLHWFFLELG